MCWLNHGIAWHIDHIVPKKAFGASKEELLIVEWHKNLQPMWADNLLKSDTYEEVDKIDLLNVTIKSMAQVYAKLLRKFLRSLARAYHAISN